MSSKTKIKAAEVEATPSLIPKLRFPEFQSNLAWERTTIGALGRFYYGKSAPKWSLSEDAPTPCVRYGELYTKFGPVIFETYSRTNTDHKSLRFSKGGEILIPRVGEKPDDFGKCCAYLPLKDVAIGEMISVLETTQHPLFYTYYFRTLYKQFAKVVEGQNVKNLYFAELEPLPILRPTVPEQQKIASCLSSLDHLITAHTQKLNALKTHKTGLMHQLFPREGETVPRLRFPEFRGDGEWEAKRLGDEGVFLSSLTGKTGADFDTGEARFITYMNVFTNTFIDPKQLRFVDVKAGENQNAVVSGDLFFTISSETPDEVGMSSVLLEDLDNCYLNSFCALFRFSDCKRLNPIFAGYLLRQPSVRAYFKKRAQGSTRFNLSKDAFRSLPICVPSAPEQQSIAFCLNSLDDLIAAQTQKLEALKTHKKGLMQGLFPTIEETEA